MPQVISPLLAVMKNLTVTFVALTSGFITPIPKAVVPSSDQTEPVSPQSNSALIGSCRTEKQSVDTPVQLEIPKINLRVAIETVGLDPDGLMSVPGEGTSVGWFKFGPKPGEVGNSVLAGHYDTAKGPAVFYNLNNVSKGDEIIVTDKKGISQKFKVYQTEVVKLADFDVQKVYGPNSNKNLNLVTCNGKYDPTLKTYNQRLIVYSKL